MMENQLVIAMNQRSRLLENRPRCHFGLANCRTWPSMSQVIELTVSQENV